MRRLALIAALLLAGATPAAAERLVLSLSNERVLIASNFVGENLVLFGVVEADAGKVFRPGGYDLVVTVSGPRETMRTRRKERVLGIWVNVDSREFVRVPSYLAVLANRPFAQITAAENLRQLQIGLDNFLLTQRIGPDLGDTVPGDPFRSAFVRLQTQYGVYRQSAAAVKFLAPAVFKVAIPLPSNVPTGSFRINVKLFAERALIAESNAALDVIKSGVEQYVADAAGNYGLFYGLATTLMALLTGWIASVVFRRD
jgi:uncharacterized protein (TIGR02186 family)